MRLIKNLALMAVMLPLVAACAVVDIDEVRNMEVKHWEFAQNLHTEYVNLAQAEADETDWEDANFFANKAIDAANAANEGSTIPDPQEIAERELPEDQVDTLINARDVLMEGLADGRRKKPGPAAHAQAMFDCWMQEQEENFQPDDIAACRAAYFEAVAQLFETEPMAEEAPEPMAETIKSVGPFMVYFAFNSSSLDPAANALIDSLASHKFAGDELGYIVLSGHTDLSGNADYNNALSERRVSAVSDAFMARGVKAKVLSTFYGEKRPAQSTSDGTREPKNRRVEITLSR